jgi:hypothetical protein
MFWRCTPKVFPKKADFQQLIGEAFEWGSEPDIFSLRRPLAGIIFRFQGTGSVDWVKLSKGDGKMIYEDEF